APYSMNNKVEKIGVQALKHSDKVKESVARIKEIRQDFMAFLEQQPNLHLLPSQANFITFTAPYAEKILEVGLTQDFNFKYYADGP
ncbi:pyridoxal phosphate-dependent aminotransferase, partial [Streptococcus pyogenes]